MRPEAPKEPSAKSALSPGHFDDIARLSEIYFPGGSEAAEFSKDDLLDNLRRLYFVSLEQGRAMKTSHRKMIEKLAITAFSAFRPSQQSGKGGAHAQKFSSSSLKDAIKTDSRYALAREKGAAPADRKNEEKKKSEDEARPNPEKMLKTAQELESQGKWGAAADAYEELRRYFVEYDTTLGPEQEQAKNVELQGKIKSNCIKEADAALEAGDRASEATRCVQAGYIAGAPELYERAISAWKEMDGRLVAKYGIPATVRNGISLEKNIISTLIGDALPSEVKDWLTQEQDRLASEYHGSAKQRKKTAREAAKLFESLAESPGTPEISMARSYKAMEIYRGLGDFEGEARCCFRAIGRGAGDFSKNIAFNLGVDACGKQVAKLNKAWASEENKEREIAGFYKRMIGHVDYSRTIDRVDDKACQGILYEKMGDACTSDYEKMESYGLATNTWLDATPNFCKRVSEKMADVYRQGNYNAKKFAKMLDNEGKPIPIRLHMYTPETYGETASSELGQAAWGFARLKLKRLTGKSQLEGYQPLEIFEKADRIIGRLAPKAQADFYDALLSQYPSWVEHAQNERGYQGETLVSRTLFQIMALEYARPGAFKELYEKRGIRHLGRYYLDDLIKEYDGLGKQESSEIGCLDSADLLRKAFREQGFKPGKKGMMRIAGLKDHEATNFDNGNAVFTVERQGGSLKVYKAVVAVIYPHDDYNGAFMQEDRTIHKLTRKFNVQICEAATVYEAARRFITISKEQGKPSVILLGGHGKFSKSKDGTIESTVALGEEDLKLTEFLSGGAVAKSEISSPMKLKSIRPETEREPRLEFTRLAEIAIEALAKSDAQSAFARDSRGNIYIAEKNGNEIEFRKRGYLSRYCTEKASVVLVSCEQGAPEGFGERMSERFPDSRVYAESIATAPKKIAFRKVLENGRVDLKYSTVAKDSERVFEHGKPAES